MNPSVLRLNAIKEKQLRHIHMSWETITETPFRPPSRAAPRISARSLPSGRAAAPQTHFFHHSQIGFTAPEIAIVQKAANSAMGESLKSGAPSRLISLQRCVTDPVRKIASFPSRRLQASSLVLGPELSDPIVSLTSVDKFFANDETAELPQSDTNSSVQGFRIPPPVTISQIRDHVWIYSHEQHPKGDTDLTAHALDGEMVEGTLNVRESRGRRKVTTIVRGYSAVEQEGRNMRKGVIGRPLRAARSAELESCYSALRYRKYLFKNHCVVPDFIDECDFQQLQAQRRAEKEKERAERLAEIASRSGMRMSMSRP
jgi:hypothetical protein